MAKRSSDPCVAYPEVKVQVRDLVRVMELLLCPMGVSIRETLLYRETQGGRQAGSPHG